MRKKLHGSSVPGFYGARLSTPLHRMRKLASSVTRNAQNKQAGNEHRQHFRLRHGTGENRSEDRMPTGGGMEIIPIKETAGIGTRLGSQACVLYIGKLVMGVGWIRDNAVHESISIELKYIGIGEL